MRLRLSTDYALRAVLFVGARGEVVTKISEISDAYEISHNHLMKVVNQLVQLGFLKSVRGRHGGLRLARAANEIFVGQIVRGFEVDQNPLDCRSCIMAKGCQLTCLMQTAVAGFLAPLDKTSIAMLLEQEVNADGPHVGHRAALVQA